MKRELKSLTSDKIIHDFKWESKGRGRKLNIMVEKMRMMLLPKELSVKMLNTHAYAYSIDNAQGSEWEYVIIFICSEDKANQFFLNKNRIYVAVTRRAIWCVGDMEAMRLGATRPVQSRHETLHMRLNPSAKE